jgi:hypothetical protein
MYLERRVAYEDLVEIPEGKREFGRPWSVQKVKTVPLQARRVPGS